MKRDSMDAVFLALACPTRRKILDIVKDRPGCGVKHVAGFFAISRIGVMKHLRVLAKAGLLLSEKEGRNRKLHFNCVPIQMIYDRWTTQYSALWASRLTKVKYRVEAREKVHG
ncbi:MAG TPA: helix-turn-helix transcriptional regulator [Pirellulales bacterium]|jgi:predicted transcriptional regulator|nr:helix-turn-helix transcriptional regulator [Pirellulales bacterium]